MFCEYDGVSVQNGEFCNVNVLPQFGVGPGGGGGAAGAAGDGAGAAAMFWAPLPHVRGAEPTTLKPSTY